MKPQLYLLAAACLLASCAPKTALRLRPVADETRFTDGLEAVKSETGGVKIVTAFESVYHTREGGQKRDYLIFNTELFNLTDHDLEVRPNDFRAVVLNADQQSLFSQHPRPDGTQRALTYLALDPDRELLETEVRMKREEARLKANKVFNTVLFVALAAAAVSTSNPNNSRSYGEYWRKSVTLDAGLQAWAIKRVADRTRFANRMDRLSWEQNNWRQETFRRTTLAPGTSLRGRLLVPANQAATFVKLSYPTPSGDVQFLFEQRAVRARP